MVRSAGNIGYGFIADFAAGGGELLTAAMSLWPKRRFVATDISTRCVSSLCRREPKWLSGRCDFLLSTSRERCRPLKAVEGKVSLVLLNPPFSYRGGKYWIATVGSRSVRCSLALAFVITSLKYLARRGKIVAVLPAGCLTSEKDRGAWRELNAVCETEVLDANGRHTFVGCYPNTVIVRFRLRPRVQPLPDNASNCKPPSPNAISVRVHRGSTQMHTVNGELASRSNVLVHSTELKAGSVELSDRRIDGGRLVLGPSVLLPRVGQPNKSKVALFAEDTPIVLSDCVIALKCNHIRAARKVKEIIVENWTLIEKRYGGTCAKYITVADLSEILRHLGLSVSLDPREAVGNSRLPSGRRARQSKNQCD